MKKTGLQTLDLVCLAAVAAAGIIHLSFPFDGDQALFNVGASKIGAGAVLYRDFWDLKQPAIFYFYLVGGTLFGFTEVGIHAFELLYMMLLSVTLLVTLRDYYKSSWVRRSVPLLTVGFYYAVAGSWHLTQAEGLVGLPLFLSLWFAAEASGRPAARFWLPFMSGVLGAVVLLFKFLFAAILLAFWATAILYAAVRGREGLRSVFARLVVPTASGVLVPTLIALGYFAWAVSPETLSFTFFEYPARAVSELPAAGFGRLLEGFRWFLGGFAPLLALGFAGACVSLARRKDLLTLNLVLWVAVGLGVIFVQRLSWWEYHYMLLFVPLGVLAAKGLDELWSLVVTRGPGGLARGLRPLLVLSLLLLFSPALLALGLKGYRLARHGFAWGKERRLNYQSDVSRHYKMALAEVAFLSEPGALPGAIFVGGNPLLYHLSGRPPAVASNGWMLELFLPEQWARLTTELDAARPPYIFISAEYPETIRRRSPATARFLEGNYREVRRDDAGVWYVLR